MNSRFGMGCCCEDNIHGGGCTTGKITVVARQDCDITSVVDATVVLKLGTTTIGTCITDATGCTFIGLGPGTYTVIITLGGVTKTITPVNIANDCAAVSVTSPSFGQTFLDLVLQGCNGWVEGATIEVYQSGVLLGTVTSEGSLVPIDGQPPYVRLHLPGPSDGTNFTLLTTMAPYWLGPGTATIASGTCAGNGNPGTINTAGGYGCCGSGFLTVLPYGPTLSCTIGGHAITLTATGGLWSGTLIADVPGRVGSCLPGGSQGTVTACLHVSWFCGNLAVSYLGCPGGSCTGGSPPVGTIAGRPLASDCTATPNVTCTSVETSHVAEPLFSTGNIFCPLGNTTPWTVTQP